MARDGITRRSGGDCGRKMYAAVLITASNVTDAVITRLNSSAPTPTYLPS